MRIPVSTQEPVRTRESPKPYNERCLRVLFTGATLDWVPSENVPIRVRSVYWRSTSSAVAGARTLHFAMNKVRLLDPPMQSVCAYYGQNVQHGASQTKYCSWAIGADAQTWYNTVNVIYETHALGEHIMVPGDWVGFVIIQGNAADDNVISIVYEVL